MLPRCLVFSGLILALVRPTPDVLQVGRNLTVAADQPLQNVTCVLCSADISGHISGRVRAFAGNVSLGGTVNGSIVVFGGHVQLAAGSVVDGSVIIIGGHLRQDLGAKCDRHTVLPPIIFLPVILLICLVMGALIRLTRRSIRGPIVFPPLPRL
jgi:hypothetical protein